MQGHMYVTELAVQALADAELKTLLQARRDFWLNGSFLPDSGYAANDPYGELAHWEQFVEAYVQWIRANYQPPFTSGPAADHVAVLMGAASHGMLDQTFDTLFVERAAELKDDTSELDTGIDAWIVNDLSRKENPPIVLDAQGVSGVFKSGFGYDVAPDTILGGLTTAKGAINLVITVLSKGDQRYRDVMPWAASHYLKSDFGGSYPSSAPVVAGYMENLWRRLYGNNALDQAVIGTWPLDAAVGVPLDRASIAAAVTLFWGHGLKPDSVTSQSVFVQDEAGAVIPCDVRTRGDAWAGMVQLKPKADWKPHARYTVVLTPGIESLHAQHLTVARSISFTTACAPGDEASCAPAVAGSGEGGGCAITGRAAGSWEALGIVALAAFGLLRRLAGK